MPHIVVEFKDKKLTLRRAIPDDAPVLRVLLNLAYKELADMGLNYTATYQDNLETLRQIKDYKVFVLFDGEKLIGTINGRQENWFSGLKSFYLGRFAVKPSLKKNGIGLLLLQQMERLAIAERFESIQLDTAKPALHLVHWYQRLGYRIIGETHFEGKTYDSWVFEKPLSDSQI